MLDVDIEETIHCAIQMQRSSSYLKPKKNARPNPNIPITHKYSTQKPALRTVSPTTSCFRLAKPHQETDDI
jgi:hypothetical protein